jgi:hypothetical protein
VNSFNKVVLLSILTCCEERGTPDIVSHTGNVLNVSEKLPNGHEIFHLEGAGQEKTLVPSS